MQALAVATMAAKVAARLRMTQKRYPDEALVVHQMHLPEVIRYAMRTHPAFRRLYTEIAEITDIQEKEISQTEITEITDIPLQPTRTANKKDKQDYASDPEPDKPYKPEKPEKERKEWSWTPADDTENTEDWKWHWKDRTRRAGDRCGVFSDTLVDHTH